MARRICDTCGHAVHDGMQYVMRGECDGCVKCDAELAARVAEDRKARPAQYRPIAPAAKADGTIRWHRADRHGPAWYAEINGERVAESVKTGSHLDDYPWDWHLTDEGLAWRFARGIRSTKTVGVSDTLRSSKEYVKLALEGAGF